MFMGLFKSRGIVFSAVSSFIFSLFLFGVAEKSSVAKSECWMTILVHGSITPIIRKPTLNLLIRLVQD